MLKVGLSGGIASGKSTVAKCFGELGVPVIDADEIARRLTVPGSAGLRAIAEAFGAKMLNRDGGLNRAALRQLAFADASARRRLNAILHPAIRDHMEKEIKKLHAPYCIIVIPLLIEAGMQDMVDCIVIVDCGEETQLQRIVARDHCDKAEAGKIIKSQHDRKKRLEVADIVVDNEGTMEHLKKQVDELHRALLHRADGDER